MPEEKNIKQKIIILVKKLRQAEAEPLIKQMLNDWCKDLNKKKSSQHLAKQPPPTERKKMVELKERNFINLQTQS